MGKNYKNIYIHFEIHAKFIDLNDKDGGWCGSSHPFITVQQTRYKIKRKKSQQLCFLFLFPLIKNPLYEF